MKAPTQRERRTIKLLVILGIFSIINFFFFFFHPDHRGNAFLFALLCITILYSAFKKLYLWYNYTNMSIPEATKKYPDFKVDILTTYFPGEPYDMITTTLEAIQRITYPHTTYLCDEADDEFLKEFCKRHGINHVTRDNRKDAKAGNINNALEKVATGDICVILDPDHIPDPNFLDPIIPHFADPNIGFVQIVQSYYNTNQSLVARGAAEQTFQFYGPMMMTLNAYGTVNAIGANCVFRRKALDSIGGHAPGLCEDMHTTMLLYAKGWKAVYLPEVLAQGLAPANLTTYFKQQLKWSRGTFDLLIKVYPRLFNKFSSRQKIHFGILPLHYLSGVIYLINFLIPVLALLWSTTPWRGNFIEFILAVLPLAASALLIRTFVQKWVIEKEERGFHILGGILQINTWWIYITGLIYTIADKKVPYLPTPKQSESATNLKIVIPNMLVAFISLAAIVYGLSEDFTPFSILMAGFALFNAAIMIFGIYLSFRSKKKSRFSKVPETPEDKKKTLLSGLGKNFGEISHSVFTFSRAAALPLLIGIIVLALGLKNKKDEMRWEDIEPIYMKKESGIYLGIFHPSEDTGLVDMDEVEILEASQNLEFDIISFYLAWNDASVDKFPYELMEKIAQKEAIPMITWEPWASTLAQNSSSPELQEEQKVMKHIAEGFFDDYISDFAEHLARYDRPVFLRFAHEFDNPQYPWSSTGNNRPEEFIAAWKRVFEILVQKGAHDVILVWNPWKAENMEMYYPGDEYVDWIGITLLNYGEQNTSGKSYSFPDLYEPFFWELKNFRQKPVMLSEFGSVKSGTNQKKWMADALSSIENRFTEISAVVLFSSAFDNNIPYPERFEAEYLDWTLDSYEPLRASFKSSPIASSPPLSPLPVVIEPKPIPFNHIKGVVYKKGMNWQDNYYVPTKEVLLEDFSKMRAAGINTIMFTGGNVFDRNILNYADEFGINAVYEFGIDEKIDYTNDEKLLQLLGDNILSKVRQLKNNENVIAYNFSMDPVESFYFKPLLLYQKKNYLKWLQSLMLKIKEIDPEKSLVFDVQVDPATAGKLEYLQRLLPIDSYNLVLEKQDQDLLTGVLNVTENLQIPTILTVPPEDIIQNGQDFKAMNIILPNWQDEWFSNRLSFDGLIDFQGRKKLIYKNIEELWTDKEFDVDPLKIRILPPAIPLLSDKVELAGNSEKYEAIVFQDQEWISASEIESHLFQWYLVKTDAYGNPLAFKEVGEGPILELEIPTSYKDYELLLTAENLKHKFVVQTRENLHLPLIK